MSLIASPRRRGSSGFSTRTPRGRASRRRLGLLGGRLGLRGGRRRCRRLSSEPESDEEPEPDASEPEGSEALGSFSSSVAAVAVRRRATAWGTRRPWPPRLPPPARDAVLVLVDRQVLGRRLVLGPGERRREPHAHEDGRRHRRDGYRLARGHVQPGEQRLLGAAWRGPVLAPDVRVGSRDAPRQPARCLPFALFAKVVLVVVPDEVGDPRPPLALDRGVDVPAWLPGRSCLVRSADPVPARRRRSPRLARRPGDGERAADQGEQEADEEAAEVGDGEGDQARAGWRRHRRRPGRASGTTGSGPGRPAARR